MLFDKELRGTVEDIVVGGGPYFGDLQWRVASLPIQVGGLGLYSAVEAFSYAFVASRAQTWVLQDHILRDSGVYGMDSDFHIALDGLRDMIPTFDLSSFTSKDTASNKVAKHEKACSDNQHAFIPFAFDTFGFLAPDVVDLLQRVHKNHA
ncbi:hypothetical protein QL285_068351 [Trifolium repens]|nr:hypothetical protein QL285_068351 [Trifolium repens]